MKDLRTVLNTRGTNLIEKVGYIINPILLNFKNEKNRILVFCFHGIYESEKEKAKNHVDPQSNMKISQFNEFIEYFLNQKYNFISPDNISNGLKNDKAYAMITFDDGYFNNSYIFETLKKFNIPAHIFLATGNIEENKSYWWDIIYRNRIRKGSSHESIRSEQSSLKTLKHSSINNYILENFGMESFTPWSDIDRPFREDEIRDFASNPLVSFGSHSHNHAILTNYNESEIRYEIEESARLIKRLTGNDPSTIAFPNGNYNDMILKISEESGIKYGFTINDRPNRLPDIDSKFVCIDRYMTKISNINEFGGFCRLGYEPEVLYNGLRIKVRKLFRGK